jgi:hypothetical protein
MLATILLRTFYLLFCCLKNVEIRIYKTVILSVVLCGCKTWSLPLRAEHRLRVSEKKVLRRIVVPKRDEVTAGWKNCITRSFVTCTFHQV